MKKHIPIKSCLRMTGLFLTMVMALLFVLNNALALSAMNTGFTTTQLSEEEKENILAYKSVTMFYEEPNKSPIDCFAVNRDGVIALGFDSWDTGTICVYDETGFLYGYTFSCAGTFGIEWDGSNIIIYDVRSDVLVSVSPTGEIVDLVEAQNTTENGRYERNHIFSTKKTVGDTEYTLRNDMGILNILATSYSQLVVTTADGEETIFYDVNQNYFTGMLILTIGVLVLIAILVVLFVWLFKKLKRRMAKS